MKLKGKISVNLYGNLEKEMATRSSILAGEFHGQKPQSMESQRVEHNWVNKKKNGRAFSSAEYDCITMAYNTIYSPCLDCR